MPNNSNDMILKRQKITAFLTFDRILKDPDFSIMKKYGKSNEFAPYINSEKIKTLSDKALSMELLTRNIENPLEYFKIKDFNTEKNYKSLYDNYDEIYLNAPELRMFKSLRSYLSSGYLSSIYIWNYTDDKRQRFELYQEFGNNQILKYITGSFMKAVEYAKPTLIYDWSAKRIFELADTENWDQSFLFIAEYLFNFEVSESGLYRLKYHLGDRKNVIAFPPYMQESLSEIKG